ncbi:MAG: hypothetical protein ACTSVC_01025 [Promethearchaeota archaeon]
MKRSTKILMIVVFEAIFITLTYSNSYYNDNDDNSTSRINYNFDKTIVYNKENLKSSAPDPPGALTSTTCPEGGWSNLGYIEIYWTASPNADGYHQEWDHSSSPPPANNTINVSGTKGYISPVTEGTYYCHVNSINTADGSTSSVVTYGPFHIDQTPPANPTSGSSSSHSNAVWSSNPTINYSWSGASDALSGIKGYAVKAATSDPGDFVGVSTNQTTYNITVDTSGQYHIYIRSSDNAGNWATGHYNSSQVYYIDLDNPNQPTELSKNFTTQWYNYELYANISWMDTDVGGSGIDGYSVLWSQNSNDEPDLTKDLEEDHNWSLSPLLTDGYWYFHVRAVDNVGHWGDTYTSSFVRIDTAKPTNPSITYCSHAVDTWSSETNFYINWSGASDSGAGVHDYFIKLDHSNDTTVTTADLSTTDTSYSATLSEDGVYYFHLRTRDYAGNLANTTLHYGPIKFDDHAPQNPDTFVSEINTSTWSSNNNFSIYWEGFNDGNGAGIDGFAYIWDTSSSTSLSPSDINSTSNSTYAPNLSQGNNWWFHLITRDNMGFWATSTVSYGPFYIDTLAPNNPTSVSCTSEVNVWSNDGNLNFSWLGASDPGGSGVAGYSILLDHNPSSVPDAVIDTTGLMYESGPLADGVYYFHIRTIDNVGNITKPEDTLHYGPYLLDSTPPDNPDPSSLICTSGQNISEWTTNNIITVQWNTAFDGSSGIAGYSYIWTRNASAIPDTTIESNTTTNTSWALSDSSSWYFILRTVDNAGNWNTTVIKLGPFYIDSTPPTLPLSYSANMSTNGTWYHEHYIEINWSGASDGDGSGIQGYSVLWTTNSSERPPESISTTLTTNISEFLPSEIYYCQIIVVDNLGQWSSGIFSVGPFKIDDDAPYENARNLHSSSHSINVWSNNNDILIAWDDALDQLSGVYGYSYILDTNPSTLPDSIVDTTGKNAEILVNATGEYYFHIICVDYAQNWNQTVINYGPFLIDLTKPTSPNTTVSTDPGVNNWTTDNTIYTQWTGAFDNDSGILGYATLWAHAPTMPGTSVNYTRDYDTSDPLPDGTWYFCIRARDEAGNWADDYYTIGPFLIDRNPPTAPTTMSANITFDQWTYTYYVSINWSGASDQGSGIKGYAVLWSQNAIDSPLNQMTTNGTSNISMQLDSGVWYVHIKSVDNTNSWSTEVFHSSAIRIDHSPPTPVVALYSNSTENGTWSSDDCFSDYLKVWMSSGTHGGASDSESGIDGYSILFSMNPNDDPGMNKTTDASVEEFFSGKLTISGRYWFHIRVVDKMGLWSSVFHYGNWSIDVTPPYNPDSFSCTTHNVSEWSQNPSITITLLNAHDDGAGGILYYYYFDNNPTGINNPQSPYYTSNKVTQTLSDGSWYLHVICADRINGSTSPRHWNMTYYNIGPFLIDTQAPTNPSSYITNQQPGVWGNHHTLTVNFTGQYDSGSGIAGYSIVWTTHEGGEAPDYTIDITNPNYVNNSIQEGIYYLSIRTCDNAGQWNPNYYVIGPFKFDFYAPDGVHSIKESEEPNGWYWGWVHISFTNQTTDVSGIMGVNYSDNGAPWKLISLSSELVIKDGNHTILYNFVDNAGNIGPTKTITLKVDGYAPSLNSSVIIIQNHGVIYKDQGLINITLNLTDQPDIINVTFYLIKDNIVLLTQTCQKLDNGLFIAYINVSKFDAGNYILGFNLTSVSGRSTYKTYYSMFAIITPKTNSGSLNYIILLIIGAIVITTLAIALKSKGREKSNQFSPLISTKPKTIPVKDINSKKIKKIKKTIGAKTPFAESSIGWKEQQKIDEVREILRRKKLEKALKEESGLSTPSKDLQTEGGARTKPPSGTTAKVGATVRSEEYDKSIDKLITDEDFTSDELFGTSQPNSNKETDNDESGFWQPSAYTSNPNNIETAVVLHLKYCPECSYLIQDIIDANTDMKCPKCGVQMVILLTCDQCHQFFSMTKEQIIKASDMPIPCPECEAQGIKSILRDVNPEELNS